MELLFAANFPAGQLAQDDAPLGLYLPGPQELHSNTLPMFALKVPAEQGVQATAPLLSLYVPAGHGVQPCPAANLPAGQGRVEVAYTPPKPVTWQPLAPKGGRGVDNVEEMPWLVQVGEEPANHTRFTVVGSP